MGAARRPKEMRRQQMAAKVKGRIVYDSNDMRIVEEEIEKYNPK